MELLSPTKEILYKQIKSQFDSHQFTATVSCISITSIHVISYQITIVYLQQSGVYSACFSNEFSTFSHKLVYMDFSLSDSENPLPVKLSDYPIIDNINDIKQFIGNRRTCNCVDTNGIDSSRNSQESQCNS